MKLRNIIFASMATLLPCMAQAQNLVPEQPSNVPDYFCTWNIQGYAVSYDGDTRNMMTEQNLFGTGPTQGWVRFFPRIRQDVLFLLDDSWNMPLDYGAVIDRYFGLVTLNQERFPSFRGDDVARLAHLCDSIRSYGWKGVGGWVCAQESPLDTAGTDQRGYWQRQFQRAHAAGMDYLKVDFGRHERDVAWRQMLTDVAHHVSPLLTVEHAQPKGPTNTDSPQLDACIAQHSDVFRTYDVETFISIPITLRRVLQVLDQRAASGIRGLINCEDEPYLAVGLGCVIGIMRHPLAGSLPDGRADHVFPVTCRDVKHRLDEVVRAVRWHRLAQPFGMDADLLVDDSLLSDTWTLADRETWHGARRVGELVSESAPARVSRRMPLPTVQSDGMAPYVLASCYPGGAVAVCTLERLQHRTWSTPRAHVGIQVPDASAPLGIFGHYQSLTVTYPVRLSRRHLRVMAQDLASDRAIDITRRVHIQGRTLTIPGEVIDQVGLMATTPGDISAPGMVLQLQK